MPWVVPLGSDALPDIIPGGEHSAEDETAAALAEMACKRRFPAFPVENRRMLHVGQVQFRDAEGILAILR